MTNFINFLPIAVVALGALVTLASEPFIRDENKHKILPWVASLFVVSGMAAFALANTDTIFNLFAMDPIRRLLGIVVLFCTFLGISGLQWTLGHEKFKGGESYGLMLLAGCGALFMTQAIDFLSLFLGMELASFPVYASRCMPSWVSAAIRKMRAKACSSTSSRVPSLAPSSCTVSP